MCSRIPEADLIKEFNHFVKSNKPDAFYMHWKIRNGRNVIITEIITIERLIAEHREKEDIPSEFIKDYRQWLVELQENQLANRLKATEKLASNAVGAFQEIGIIASNGCDAGNYEETLKQIVRCIQATLPHLK